ncbi:hypothetical protein [Thalassorhabdomicrobium marinisediminis]|uniref:hypothetical protein n=1 Tax=Thalassorhabdomicrobium marinisediminis TaxID=2170577 RepID=UPI0024929B69|nr:hypothetical protein [Thalassorhabdomicrobium marinisediminis]
MEIALHLGAHGCASTSFHTYLRANQAGLLRQGLACKLPDVTRSGWMGGLFRHPAQITLADEMRGRRAVGRMRLSFALAQCAGVRQLVISDPDLLGRRRENLSATALYPLASERLIRLRDAFAGHRLRIGLSIRSPEDYWTFCLAREVVQGRAAPGVDLLDRLTTQPRRWRHVIRDLKRALPEAEIVVWPFERFLARPDHQLQLLTGQSWSAWDAVDSWARRSPTPARLAAASGASAPDAAAVTKDRWMPFDAEHRRVLRAEYRRDLAWLKAGAQGFARWCDGAPQPAPAAASVPFKSKRNSGPQGPETRPDRAEVIHAATQNAALFGGRSNDIRHSRIEKGVGRAGTG